MLDSETVIRSPHDATVTLRRGNKHVQVNDPRTSVTMADQGCEVVLFFEGADFSGEAQLLEVRMLPAAGAPFEPWRCVRRLPLYLKYARAAMTWEHRDATKALWVLRQLGNTRRGLSDDFYRRIARSYMAKSSAPSWKVNVRFSPG